MRAETIRWQQGHADADANNAMMHTLVLMTAATNKAGNNDSPSKSSVNDSAEECVFRILDIMVAISLAKKMTVPKIVAIAHDQRAQRAHNLNQTVRAIMDDHIGEPTASAC